MTAPGQVITLGTAGGPMQNPDRAQPAHLLLTAAAPILVDCGDGAVGQMRRAGFEFRAISDVVLTHHHGDHIGGLFALLMVSMMTQRRTPLVVHGPPGTAAILAGLTAACDGPQAIGFGVPGQVLPHPRDFVEVREIAPGDTRQIGDVRLSVCENTHYRSEDQFGTPGPVSLSCRFDLPGRSVVFTGDTGVCRALEGLAKGSDLLIGEMMDLDITMARVRANNPTMPDAQIDRIRNHLGSHHLSPEELGDLARVAGVGAVVAVHFPPGVAGPASTAGYVARIAARYSGRVEIGADLGRY